MKHKLISNFNMNLDSIESHLSIAEDVDCRAGAVGFTLVLKTNDLEVKLETSYRLKGDYELKYYRNQQMVKHIRNGNLIVDQITNEELVSLMKTNDSNNISNLSIISLNFDNEDKKLISRFTDDKINRLIIDKKMKIPELVAANQQKTFTSGVSLTTSELQDTEEEEDEDDDDDEHQEEPDNSKWRFLALEPEAENPVVTEEKSHLENVGQTVTNIIGKGLEMFDNKPTNTEPKNFDKKKENDSKKEDQKNSPYSFNEGMS